jgi:hypothetical protein
MVCAMLCATDKLMACVNGETDLHALDLPSLQLAP